MKLSIIIINYNTFELTCNCIRSVQQYVKNVAYEIVVVDNASPKDDPDEFLRLFPQITLVKNPENNGFAKGNNLGIQHSTGEYMLLLNSDAYMTEDCISAPLALYEANKNVGVVAVKVLYPDGLYQKNARRFRSIRNELLDLVRPLLYLFPYRQRAKLMLNQYFKGDFDTEVDWLGGAWFMFPRRVLAELPVKKLDERFFMYGEDALWCYQFKEAGYTNYFLSGATAVHIANASTEPEKQIKLLKTMLKHELEIAAYIHGKGLYYYVFKAIFCTKEWSRYYIKVLIWKLLGKKMR